MDLKNMDLKNVCVMIDKNLVNLPSIRTAFDSLAKQQVNYEVFDEIRVEPSHESMSRAIEFARSRHFDSFVAIGGKFQRSKR